MEHYKFAFLFLIFIVFIASLSVITSLFSPTDKQHDSNLKNKILVNANDEQALKNANDEQVLKNANDKISEAIKVLVRQISRWTLASQQDLNSLIALLHANYGAGYLWALKDIASESEIKRALPDLDLKKLTEIVVSTQDSATQRVAKQLDTKFDIRENHSFLANLAGH